MRKGDATNYIKGLNDFIFNKTSSCPNSVMIDDRFITCCTIIQGNSEGVIIDRCLDKGMTYVIVEINLRSEE